MSLDPKHPPEHSPARVKSLASLCCKVLAPYVAAPDFPFDAFELLPWEGPGSLLFREARHCGSFARGPHAVAAFVRYYCESMPKAFFSLALRGTAVSSAGTAIHSGTAYSRGDAQIAQRIMRITNLIHLTRLELRDAHLKDGDAGHLCSLTNLRTLDVSGNPQFGDNGFATFARATAGAKRRHSELEDDFSEEAPSRGFGKLEHLNMAGTSITDISMPLFSRFPALLAFDVSRTYISFGEGIKPLLHGLEGWRVLDPSNPIFPEPEPPQTPNQTAKSPWVDPNKVKQDEKERGEAMVRKFVGAQLADPLSDPGLAFVLQEARKDESDEDLAEFVLGQGPKVQVRVPTWRDRGFAWDAVSEPLAPSSERVWVVGSKTTFARVETDSGSQDPFERTFKADWQPAWKEKPGRTPCIWRIARGEIPIIEEVHVRSHGFGVYKAPEKGEQAKPATLSQTQCGPLMKDHSGKFAVHANVVPLAKKTTAAVAPGKPGGPKNPFAAPKSKDGFLDELLGSQENSRHKKANRKEWWKGWSK